MDQEVCGVFFLSQVLFPGSRDSLVSPVYARERCGDQGSPGSEAAFLGAPPYPRPIQARQNPAGSGQRSHDSAGPRCLGRGVDVYCSGHGRCEALCCQTSKPGGRQPELADDHLLPLGKPELKGFNLNPLNQDELKALKVILKG